MLRFFSFLGQHAFPRGAALLLLAATGGCTTDPYEGRDIVLCYRTLADVSCYARPDAGRDGQLVGFYLRDAGDPAAKDEVLRAALARIAGS